MIQSLSEFEDLVQLHHSEDRELIMKAVEKSRRLHDGQFRESGQPYFIHPLQVAETLVRMRLDTASIVAGLLHDSIEDTKYSREDLQEDFGGHVSSLVEGVTKINIVDPEDPHSKSAAQVHSMQKIFFAMAKDIRVILIKLADKLNNMRTLEHKSAARIRAIAQECLDIYAPLAHRLGISWMKAELEDLSLKHLRPDVYEKIKIHINTKKSERSEFLAQITEKIKNRAQAHSMEIDIQTRAKHFYSIYSKMQNRGKGLDEIYDFLGVRIICSTMTNCYTMLGLIHDLWPSIENRFKDYISMPKSNKYQSLHTTIMTEDGQILEVQLRTSEMDQTAEHGVAAHWLYKAKTGSASPADNHQDLAFIKSMKELEISDAQEFLNEMKQEILKDSIYVFTPKGDVIQLPHGATALDFAYHIHTDIGNHVAGAKADSSIIPLRQELKNTQIVEIITSAKAQPKLDWLRFVRTRTARSKIRAWINKHHEDLFVDRNIVVRQAPPQVQQGGREREKSQKIAQLKTDSVRVGNESNVLVHFANCCSPQPGDDIIGYTSRSRGIIVHRQDCKNFLKLSDVQERMMHVEWEVGNPRVIRSFRIISLRSPTLLARIEAIIYKHKGNIIELNIDHDDEDMLRIHCKVDFDVKVREQTVIGAIRSLKNIRMVEALRASG